MFFYKHCAMVTFITAAFLCEWQTIAIEDDEYIEEEMSFNEPTDSEVVNMIAEFLDNLDEEKAKEIRDIIQKTVKKSVKNNVKQYATMFDNLEKADSKGFTKIVNTLAQKSEICEELELIAKNCSSMVTKTMIRSAIKEAKEEH